MASLGFFLCVLVSCAILINPISCSKPRIKHGALFVFGDSLFDSGNNQYLNSSMKGVETSWPYGETFFKHPTGRRSDGRLVPDFIALFAKLPMPPPYLQPGAHNLTDGSNFASGGAGVLQETGHGSIYLGLQLNYFKAAAKSIRQKLGNTEARNLLKRSVYLFSIGGNDYSTVYFQNPNATQSYWLGFEKMVIGNITNVLKDIYSMGGRKFAFQNVAPLGCLPGTKARNNGSCDEKLLQLAQLHNNALSNALKKLQSQLLPAEFKYSIFDYYHSLSERINNPTKYGFKVGDGACCGTGAYRSGSCGMGTYELCSNPSEYVWFDGGHTTESANWQLAKLLWSGARNVTGPYNVKQLFGHSVK